MIRRLIFSFCLVASLFYGRLWGQQQQAINVFQAVYIYNLAKYIVFPPARQTGNYIIGVWGRSDITPHLEKMSSLKKSASGQTIKIQQVDDATSALDCHILYLPGNRSSKIKDLIAPLKGKATIIVTDGTGTCKGKDICGISLVPESARKFEVNRTNIEAVNIRISSELLKLAEISQ